MMRSLLTWVCVVVAALLMGSGVGAQEPTGDTAQRPDELQACPPPEGACSEEVVVHVLMESVGSWRRQQDLVSGDVAITPALMARLPEQAREDLSIYHPICGAAVTYRNSEGPGVADVLMIGFSNTLDALGFFASRRTESAERVLLTSAAYRDRGVLHVYSCAFYFQVQVREAEEGPLPPDQYIAARLEVRLPQREKLPRLLQAMPRGWLNALTVSYGPTELLGGEVSPMAAGATQLVGEARMRLQIMEAADEEEARRWYTLLLQRALEGGRAWQVPRLGEEGFFSRNGGPAVGMLQDRFVVHLVTDGARDDTEAIMRLVGTAIRITRELPDDAEGYCPPLLPADGS